MGSSHHHVVDGDPAVGREVLQHGDQELQTAIPPHWPGHRSCERSEESEEGLLWTGTPLCQSFSIPGLANNSLSEPLSSPSSHEF